MYQLIHLRPGAPLSEAPRIRQSQTPSYQQLRGFVGGPIETVPYFDHFEGKRAVVFCHEEHKLENHPVNNTATALWWRELGPSMASQLRDYLGGNVVIITCDTEEELREL